MKPLTHEYFKSLAVFSLLFSAFSPPLTAHAATGPRCYVDADATGTNSGDSWTDAYVLLRPALQDGNCTEIWVAEGVYKPALTSANPGYSFIVLDGQEVYGGFAGTETLLADRDPIANVTILSGDLDGDDLNGDGNFISEAAGDVVGQNSFHVVMMYAFSGPMTTSTVLDGFTITAGDAYDNNLIGVTDGGGLWCAIGYGYGCNPLLSNLVFSGNIAVRGGAIYNEAHGTGFVSSPTLVNTIFSGNYATFNGGALYNDGNNGGVSSPSLSNVVFRGNVADYYGGAIYNDGGNDFPATVYGTSAPTLVNVTFNGNTSTSYDAGAIYTWNHTGFAGPSLSNVIMWGNTAPDGHEMVSTSVLPNIDHSLILGSMPGGVWDPGLGVDGGGNLDVNPLFENAGTGDLRLQLGSPAIDTGTNTGCPLADVSSLPRPQGPLCDIGAYEHPYYAISGNAGSDGVVLGYDNGGAQTATADGNGNYGIAIPGGWSGTVTPSKPDYLFNPTNRTYSNVVADMTDQDYEAFLDSPTILHEYPAAGSTSCLKPAVGVDLQLNSLVRTGSGNFNPAVVTLKFDGATVTNMASISETLTKPASQALILYRVPNNLTAGTYQAAFTFPTPLGPETHTWDFHPAGITCPMSSEPLTEAGASGMWAPLTSEPLSAPLTDSMNRPQTQSMAADTTQDSFALESEHEVESSQPEITPVLEGALTEPEIPAPVQSAPPQATDLSEGPSGTRGIPARESDAPNWGAAVPATTPRARGVPHPGLYWLLLSGKL